MQQGDQWSDHDHDGDEDDLASLKPNSDSDDEEDYDEEFEQARLQVLQLREEQAKKKMQQRLNPPAPESRDEKMTNDTEAQGPKEASLGAGSRKGQRSFRRSRA